MHSNLLLLSVCVSVCVHERGTENVTHSHSNLWRSLNTPVLRDDIEFSLRNLKQRDESRNMNKLVAQGRKTYICYIKIDINVIINSSFAEIVLQILE